MAVDEPNKSVLLLKVDFAVMLSEGQAEPGALSNQKIQANIKDVVGSTDPKLMKRLREDQVFQSEVRTTVGSK